MDAIEALIMGMPADAERIRRRFWRDSEFRTVCEDHRDAVTAAARLKRPDPRRAEEYRQLAAELLAEAAQMLEGDRRCG